MHRIRRFVVAAVAAATILIPTVGPTEAASAVTVDFQGTMSLPPTGYPLLSSPTSGAIAVTSLVCAAAGAGTPAVQAGSCQALLTGRVGGGISGLPGQCGMWGATLRGTIDLPQGLVDVSVTLENVGGTITVAGTAKTSAGESGPIAGTLREVPYLDPIYVTGCLYRTNTSTTVLGSLVLSVR